MAMARLVLRTLGFGLIGLMLVLGLALGLAQMPAGKAWIAAALGRWLSSPGETVTITGLEGFVPFSVTARRVTATDAGGPLIAIDDLAIATAPAELLAGRLRISRLAAREIRLERWPEGGGGTDLAALLNPPLALILDRLEIEKLRLGVAISGEAMMLRVSGSAALARDRVIVDVAAQRSDDRAGEARLHLDFGDAPQRLRLTAEIIEPGGEALAALLHHAAPLPLTLTLAGDGSLADWRGRLTAKAGDAASLDADLRITGEPSHRLAIDATARLTPLLAPTLQPLLGDKQTLSAALLWGADNALRLDSGHLATDFGALTAQGRFDRGSGALAGTATLAIPSLAPLTPWLGSDIAGAGQAEITISQERAEPVATMSLRLDHPSFAGSQAALAAAAITSRPRGNPFDPATVIALDGSGQVEDLVPASGPLPAGLGKAVAWRLAANADRHNQRIDIGELALTASGMTVEAEGAIDRSGAAGEARLDIADIARLADSPVQGRLRLAADFRAAGDGSATAVLGGRIEDASTGRAELDALLGRQPELSGTLRRSSDGTLTAEAVAVTGAAARLGGEGRRSPEGAIDGRYHLDLPEIEAIDHRLAGRVSVEGTLTGRGNMLSAAATLAGTGLAIGSAHLDRVEARLTFPDIARPAGQIEADFAAGNLGGKAGAAVTFDPPSHLRLGQIHIASAGAHIAGRLSLDLASGRAEGMLTGDARELQPWSALIGKPVGGSVQLKATLAGKRGQELDLALTGTQLHWEDWTAQKLEMTARLTDLLGKPSGSAEIDLAGVGNDRLRLDRLRLSGRASRPGRFTLAADAAGTLVAPFALTASATASLDRGALDLRLATLTGKLAGEALQLREPLDLYWHQSDVSLAPLVLAIGEGQLTGNGAIKGKALSLRLHAQHLAVQPIARFFGQSDFSGALGFDLTIGGTRRQPEGALILDGTELRFATASRKDLPPLAVVAAVEWREGQARLRGRIAGPHDAALGYTGTIPFVLDGDSLVPHLPPDGVLALHLEGGGTLAPLADLLPLGEDRLAGNFFIDVSVEGTIAAPLARGRFSVSEGRYESLAAGTILTGLHFDILGDRDRLVLKNFAANDGARGVVEVTGAADLAATPGPALDVMVRLTKFRAVRLDEATATVSGDFRLAGTLVAPRLEAKLRVDEAELRVPEKLPRRIQPIAVIKINSATGELLSAPQENASPSPWLALTLALDIDAPGQVFVRGRGLESEWRGHLAITGTTAAPALMGKLEVVRGTYSILGKTFTLTRGVISFLGGHKLDPQIDIAAQASSADVIAIVQLTGTATQPTLGLTSQPELPQDEILSRLLFGSGVGQISAMQGLELAQAAASLATDGPDVFDKVRRGLGLDRLVIGSSASNSLLPTLATPSLSTTPGLPGSAPATGPGTSLAPAGGYAGAPTPGTSISAGKYVASGVYVGVTQGLTGGSSTVDVQIDVTKHISIESQAGTTTGVGMGVNWRLDY